MRQSYAHRMVRQSSLHDRVAAGILDSAAAVLARRGEAASMAEIADAAGVGRATLYRYFPNRDALMTGLTTAVVAELCDRIADAELTTVAVAEGIARVTRGFVGAGSKYSALLQEARKEPAEEAELDSKLGEPVRELLRRGVADGTLRADLPPAVLFELFTGLLERALQLVVRDELGVEQASSAMLTVFLDGARPRGSSSTG
jgi:TetR/AcrR family transcriptional repressor of mexCD-oprJ operon